MCHLPENICIEILSMEKEDLNLTEQLCNDGLLKECGYHPELEKCHKHNSKELLHATTDKNSIVMDFFAGSGTLGQAVKSLNGEDGGTRIYSR